MKITSLKGGRHNKVWLKLERQPGFPIHLDVMVKKQLKAGLELSFEEVEKILLESYQLFLFQSALDKIMRRPHSVQEVQLYLKKRLFVLNKYLEKIPDFLAIIKKQETSLINSVINKLTFKHYLDDQVFAKWWLEQRARNKPRGSLLLNQELKVKGVDESLINTLISQSETTNVEHQKEQIRTLVEKKGGQLKTRNLEKKKLKERLSRFVLSKGYQWDQIRPIIDEWLKTDYN